MLITNTNPPLNRIYSHVTNQRVKSLLDDLCSFADGHPVFSYGKVQYIVKEVQGVKPGNIPRIKTHCGRYFYHSNLKTLIKENVK